MVSSMTRPLLLALVAGVALLGCGGSTRGTRTSTIVVPSRVTAPTYARARRDYFRLGLDDGERTRMRERLLDYLAEDGAQLLEGHDYDAVVTHFAAMTELYVPADFDAHVLSPTLAPFARWLVEHGSPRGDEARVRAGLRVLTALAPEDTDVARQYAELSAWGRDARAHLPGPTERLDGLVTISEEEARLAPAPDVLSALASLYVERRDEYVRLVSARGEALFSSGLTLEDFRAANLAVARAPLDVAATYLAVADLAQAKARVAAMGGVAATEGQLVDVLAAALHDDDEANEALLVLAHGYLEEEIGRPDVSRALCRLGERRAPSDARFPRELARVAAIDGSPAEAVALYEDAIRLEPGSRTFYDEALAVIAQLVEEGGASDDVDLTAIAAAAERLETERATRFPGDRPSIMPEQLWLALGTREMETGDPAAAEIHLQKSIDQRETPEALAQLGLLCLRTQRGARAIELYRRALDLVPPAGAGDARARALASLGDALQAAGNGAQAQRMWAEALELYAAQARHGNGEPVPALDAERGVLLDRLGRHDDAARAFRSAASEASGEAAVFSRMLAYLVTADPVDLRLAEELRRDAERQVALPPTSRVHFALWVRAISARAHGPVDADVDDTLRESRRESGWTGALARFGAGDLDEAGLLSFATTRREQAEARFYGGTRRLAEGRTEEARASFESVLRSGMVGAHEYEMAQALTGGVETPAPTAQNR